MNIMRKLRGGGGAVNTSVPDEAGTAQHAALGLMHLKKLFSEYTHPAQNLSDKERDDKLYNMLPLFCKVIIIDFIAIYKIPSDYILKRGIDWQYNLSASFNVQ